MSLLAGRGAWVAVTQGACASTTEVEASALLDAALQYAREGWAVAPLHSIVDGDCTCRPSSSKRASDGHCREAGKHPRTGHGIKDATQDEETIRAWWNKWPDANIGGATGRRSNRIAIDVDLHGDVDGFVRLAELEAQYGLLPPTRQHRTGGGGKHHIYRYVPGMQSHHLHGVDLLSDGRYIVLPPSVHRSGSAYEIEEAQPVASLPLGWRQAFSDQASGLPQWLPKTIPVGTRDDTLFKLAGYLRRYGATAQKILDVLRRVTNSRVVQPPGDEISDERLQRMALDVERKFPPADIVPLFSRWDAIGRSWTGRHAATDRRVLGAVVAIAGMRRASGLSPFDMELPVRVVAERAMMGEKAVTSSLARLVADRGILAKLHGYHPTLHPNGTVYRLLQPEDASCEPHTPPQPGESGLISVVRRKHHDLFRRGGGGLGYLAEDAYCLLDAASPMRGCDLNRRLGRRASLSGGIVKALGKLEENGLAVRRGGGWLRGPADLDEVAEGLGVAGRAEKQKERHRAERAAFNSPEAKVGRQRKAKERERLAAEVLSCAADVAHAALPSGLVGTGAETWSTWAKTAKRKDLTAALVELRTVKRAELSNGITGGKLVAAEALLLPAVGRAIRHACSTAVRPARVDRNGRPSARSASHGGWARSARTFGASPSRAFDRSSARAAPTDAAAA